MVLLELWSFCEILQEVGVSWVESHDKITAKNWKFDELNQVYFHRIVHRAYFNDIADSLEINLKCFQKVVMELKRNYTMEFSTETLTDNFSQA